MMEEVDRELIDQALQRCIGFIIETCDLIAASDLANVAFHISLEDENRYFSRDFNGKINSC